MTPEYERYWLGFYTRVASSYDAKARFFIYLAGGTSVLRNLLREHLGHRGGLRVLDMCCGTGLLTLQIASALSAHTNVVGIDLCPAMIAQAATRATRDVTFELGDAAATGFPSAIFDAVTIVAALHEMPRPERCTVLREARRVLKADGILIIGEHFASNHPVFGRLQRFVFRLISKHPERHTFDDMVRHGLTQEMAETGFTLVDSHVTPTRIFYFVLAIPSS